MKRFAVVLATLVLGIAPALAQEEEFFSPFELSKNNAANTQALASQLAALSPRVNRSEAKRVAEYAYATVARLRREYRMFGTPIFNNFLVYHGLRKRGYCYQWMEDLLLALDALKLNTLELHWGETYAGNWRENNCLVVTAKGQQFEHGIMLEAWSHLGHLRWRPVVSDEQHYVENRKYAEKVRARAASKTAVANRHVALQTRAARNVKADE